MSDTKLLTPDEVASLECKWIADGLSEEETDEAIGALCQTVRALRKRLDDALVRAAEDQDYDSEQRAVIVQQLAAVTQERQEWLTWGDDLTGNKHYLPSKMRSQIADFRARAVQLCRDKAAEWDTDDRYGRWFTAAQEIATALEQLQ